MLEAINAGFGALNNQMLQPINGKLNSILSTVNIVNSKLGARLVGGLSTWVSNLANVANNSQILNTLTYISVLHNAFMLSNGIKQTLFSAVSSSLSVLGLKDYSKDPAGEEYDVNKIVNGWVEGFFVAVLGKSTVEQVEKDWKKYNRIYQAAANLLFSIQSMIHSVISGVEIVANRVARVANALVKWRAVGEKAYSLMNPQASFHNPFFTNLEKMQQAADGVDQIAQSVLSAKQAVEEIGKAKEELDKSLGETPDGTKATEEPKAEKTIDAATKAKTESKSPTIADADLIKKEKEDNGVA
jgi:hypothetical protein